MILAYSCLIVKSEPMYETEWNGGQRPVFGARVERGTETRFWRAFASALDLLLISCPEARTRFAVFAHYYDLFPNVPGHVRIFPDISGLFRTFPNISGLFRDRNNAQKPQPRVSVSSKNWSLSPVSLSQKPDKKQQKKGLTFLYRQRIIRFAVEETAKCAHSSTG